MTQEQRPPTSPQRETILPLPSPQTPAPKKTTRSTTLNKPRPTAPPPHRPLRRPKEDKEPNPPTHLVAMPEHLASVLSATLSPNKIFLTGPRTVATCVTGLNTSPSCTCHSTLPRCTVTYASALPSFFPFFAFLPSRPADEQMPRHTPETPPLRDTPPRKGRTEPKIQRTNERTTPPAPKNQRTKKKEKETNRLTNTHTA
jgi:hypothetical protein